MRRRLRALAAGLAAITAVAVTASPAYAAHAWGEEFKGCRNHVIFDYARDGSGRMSGQGVLVCDQVRSVLRPEISVGYRNKFYFKGNLCTSVSYCATPVLYVPYQAGYRYTAQNAGTINQDFIWPQSTWAIVTVTG